MKPAPHSSLLSFAGQSALLVAGALAIGDLSLAASQGPAKSPYPMYGVNAKHTNRSAYLGPINQPEIQWVYEYPEDIPGTAIAEMPPSIGEDGSIYFGVRYTNPNYGLVGVQPNGHQKWVYPTLNGVSGTPALDDQGHAYINVGTAGGREGLIKLEVSGPTELWFLPTQDSAYFSSPVIGSDSLVYFGAYDQLVHAVRPDGIEEWQHSLARIPFVSPAIDDAGIVYVAGGEAGPGRKGGRARALHPNGTMKWERSLPDKNYGSLYGATVLDDGNIVFRGSEGSVTLFDIDGNRLWETKHPGSTSGPTGALSPDGSTLYMKVGSYSLNPTFRLLAIDVKDGSTIWSHTYDPIVVRLDSPIVGADGTIYTSGPAATMMAFDPTGGVLWTKSLAPHLPKGAAEAHWPIIGFHRDLYVIVVAGPRLRLVSLRNTREVSSTPLGTKPKPKR